MSGARFVRRTRIAAPAADVFRWHSRPGAFERLTPPGEAVRVIEHTGGIENGARAVLRMGAGPFAEQACQLGVRHVTVRLRLDLAAAQVEQRPLRVVQFVEP